VWHLEQTDAATSQAHYPVRLIDCRRGMPDSPAAGGLVLERLGFSFKEAVAPDMVDAMLFPGSDVLCSLFEQRVSSVDDPFSRLGALRISR
jgi:hypothetical protein